MTFFGVISYFDEIQIENVWITINNLSYQNGELGINASTLINWSSVNTNIDSGAFPYLSASSSTSKSIQSNLTQSITASVLFNVDSCDSVGNIRDISGSSRQLFQRGSYSCQNGQVTLIGLVVEPGAQTELSIEYSCSTFTTSGYRIIMIFASLMLILFPLGYIWKNGLEEINVQVILIIFVGLMIGVSLWLTSGQNLGASCLVS